MGYNFKDKYYDYLGNDVEYSLAGRVRFYTASRNSGGGNTRSNPTSSVGTFTFSSTSDVYALILDGGSHYRMYLSSATNGESSGLRVIGSGAHLSRLQFSMTNTASFGGYLLLKDLTTYGNCVFSTNNTYYGSYIRLDKCIINSTFTRTENQTPMLKIYNCRFYKDLNSLGTVSFNAVGSANSFIRVQISSLQSNYVSLNAFDSCDINITQAVLAKYSNYWSFDNCRFKFPSDTEYTALNGDTPEELRNDFISRCDANGLTYNRITEYDYDNVPLGRWLFTTGNSSEGIIYKDTDIDNFETTRGIRFGFSSTRPSRIKITNDNSLPGSINPGNPNSGNIVFNENSVSFPSDTDITEDNDFHVTSNIMALNGIRKIDGIFTPNRLPWEYGFIVDAEKNIDLDNPVLPGSSQIESGAFYIVRSTDKNYATAVYNGTTYNTSLASIRANIIVGVDGVTSFTAGQGNPVLYKIVDNRQYQSVQIRIVNSIPGDIIKTGNLLSNYWYLVEHDTDQSNTTDYVTYNGLKYYSGASFLVRSGVLTFTTSGNIHLRRCWNEDYNPDDAQDKAFWANEQKPKWINVNPSDMYCLMKANNGGESEMQADAEGAYITSGHPDFYNRVLGSGGVLLPKYPIKGAYLQIRIVMSTLNIM